jgi:hypothetical protein
MTAICQRTLSRSPTHILSSCSLAMRCASGKNPALTK